MLYFSIPTTAYARIHFSVIGIALMKIQQSYIHTLAPNRSVVFFSVSLLNIKEGIKMQTMFPIVDPTILRTFSMSGVLMPTTNVMIMTPRVIPLDLKVAYG